MGYEIVKSIEVNEKEKKVIVYGASNNVRPREYTRWECFPLTKIYREKGREAVDVEILRSYEEGNFQGGKNKYTKALLILRHFPEYKKYDWRTTGLGIEKNRSDAEFTELLKKALKSRLPKEKFVVSRLIGGARYYLKIKRNHGNWFPDFKLATIFHYWVDAKNTKDCFYNGKDWEILSLKDLVGERL